MEQHTYHCNQTNDNNLKRITMSKLPTQQIIDLAIEYSSDNSNALFCIEQANRMISVDDSASRMWAIKSLKYSIGICNSIYKSIVINSK